MLKQRVITALILAALVLWAILGWSNFWFAALLLVGGALCTSEWATLTRIEDKKWLLTALLTSVTAIGMWLVSSAWLKPVVLCVLLVWIAIAFDLYLRPTLARCDAPAPARFALGVLTVVCAVICLYWMRTLENGPGYVIFTIVIVACADIGAYFTGRRFGKHSLAPQISAGKTVEGAVGGLLLALYCSLFTAQAFANEQVSATSIFLLSMVAAALSIAGDLFVSRAKRSRDVKDSGVLLPGHGGALDRFDGLLAAVPVMAFIMLWL